MAQWPPLMRGHPFWEATFTQHLGWLLVRGFTVFILWVKIFHGIEYPDTWYKSSVLVDFNGGSGGGGIQKVDVLDNSSYTPLST